jgi:hypothetical protein
MNTDELLAEIRLAFPLVEMPSQVDLRFHPDGCLQCDFLSQYLDEHRDGIINGAVIRYMHIEMTGLSAKGWSWALPHYLPYCLTPEAEYNQSETEYLIYNLGPSDEFKDETKERLSGLSNQQIRCLKHFLDWLIQHPKWSDYCPEDIVRAIQIVNELDA